MSPNQSDWEAEFKTAMLRNADEAKRRLSIQSDKFRVKIDRLGAKAYAVELLESKNPAEGFTKLVETGDPKNLKLSLEYLVLRNPWRTYFTKEQRGKARRRLSDVRGELPPEDVESGESDH